MTIDDKELQITADILRMEPGISVEEMHSRYVVQRLTEGFCAPGSAPGIERASLIPWASLTDTQRARAVEIHASLGGGSL